VDEYTLSINMGDDLASAMEEHYKTFIVSAGLRVAAAAWLGTLIFAPLLAYDDGA
jgi:hypothetical protein